MSATVKLESIRFVKRVSNGGSLSKYGYIGMMEQNADAIKTAPWVSSSSPYDSVSLTTNQLSKTDGVFDAETNAWTTLPTYTAYMVDIYDCFNQAGDAVARNATMCGYAGCVAYRFKLPTSETANALNSISLSLQRDRYLRAGVRIGLALSNSDAPSDDWSVVRGEATGCVRSESTAPAEGVVGVSSFGFLGQPDVPYLTASRAASGVLTLDTSTAFAAAASYQYLYIYITLEDPSGYWNLYKESQQRQYYIEGSAMLVSDNCTFTFASEPAASTPTELVIGYSGPNRSGNHYNGVVPLNLGEHPFAATDLTFISSCGAPAVVLDGDQPSFNVSAFKDNNGSIPSIKSIGNGDFKEVATKAIYMQFLNNNFTRCPIYGSSGMSIQPAASFNVFIGNDLLFMARKKVLVPFALPTGFRPSRIRFDWRNYGDETIYNFGNLELRHNAWIAKGDLSCKYDLEILKHHEIYTAETDSNGPFNLIGSFLHHVEEAAVGDPDFSYTFDLPYKLDRGPYTILLTAFFDQDQITYDGSGYLNDVTFGDDTNDYITDGPFYAYGALSDGWAPKITLIA